MYSGHPGIGSRHTAGNAAQPGGCNVTRVTVESGLPVTLTEPAALKPVLADPGLPAQPPSVAPVTSLLQFR